MNKSFVVFDKLNSVAFYCYPLVRFNFDNSDYLIYYLPDNNSKCRIFTSELIKNSSDNYLLQDILDVNKSKLLDLSYSIVVSLPTSYSHDVDINKYFDDFSSNFGIKFSNDIPNLFDQSFCPNSFLANSDLDYISDVYSFYNVNLPKLNESISNSSLIWNIPISSSDENTDNFTIDLNHSSNSVLVNDHFTVFHNDNNDNNDNNQFLGLGNINSIIPSSESSLNEYTNNTDIISNSNSYNALNSYDYQLPFNSIDYNNKPNINSSSELNTFSSYNYNTLVFKPQDTTSGGNVPKQDSNKIRVLKKNAGFASNSYIIIGTVCLILAAIIVGISIVVVKNL